ncbi:MAG: hypothetical protein QXM12_01740 [Nitrososphaerota archaeon]
MRTYEFARLLREHGVKITSQEMRVNVKRLIKVLSEEDLIKILTISEQEGDRWLMKTVTEELIRRKAKET